MGPTTFGPIPFGSLLQQSGTTWKWLEFGLKAETLLLAKKEAALGKDRMKRRNSSCLLCYSLLIWLLYRMYKIYNETPFSLLCGHVSNYC